MSTENDDSKRLKIANYFFEVGLANDSLSKQLAKQLNEECMNNRRKLKRLLSNANPDILSENKELLQNYKRKENISNITESLSSLNSLSANNTSLTFSSISSIYHSDQSIEVKKNNNNDEIVDHIIPVPTSIKNSTNSINSLSTDIMASKNKSAVDLELNKNLPPLPPSPINNQQNDTEDRSIYIIHLIIN